MEEKLSAEDKKVLDGADAFKLYDTYGFPMDLTKEILEEKGYDIDEEGFTVCMQEQRQKARDARKVSNYMGKDATVYDEIDPSVTSVFVGYEKTECESPITVLTTETELTDALTDGQTGTIFTQETPFYATSGGQMADTGVITGPEGTFEVKDVVKLLGGKIGHIGVVTSGMFKKGDVVKLAINKEKRSDTAKNHSATHLLQKALRIVLGSHVEQAGSFNNQDKLRFDFTHFSALTQEELDRVEAIVNEEIAKGLPVLTKVMNIEDAKKTGAMALFGEKYSDDVRVVSMGDFSKELCGGTHTDNTASIAAFKIISETGVAAGVRRIEALTGNGVFKYYKEVEKELHEAAKTAKCDPAQLVKRIEGLHEEIKTLTAENNQLKNKMAKDAMGDVMNQVKDVNGVSFLPVHVKDIDMQELMNLGDQLKAKLGDGVILLASENGGKVSLLAMATDGAMKKGAHAGNLIKAVAKLVGGGGGGRPNMAQAGGKNPAGINQALEAGAEELAKQLH